VSVSSSTTACDSGSYSYWVGTKDTFIPQDAPEMQSADITNDYNNSDPGPKHACASGGLGPTTFDTDTTVQNSNATFELLPNSTYTCVSVSPGTGVMSWNNSTQDAIDQRKRLPRRQPDNFPIRHVHGNGCDRSWRNDHVQR